MCGVGQRNTVAGNYLYASDASFSCTEQRTLGALRVFRLMEYGNL